MTPFSQIFKRTWQLSFAMTMSRLLNTVTSFVGILMVGRLGEASLAASALMTSTQITLVLIAMSLLFAVGITVGHHFGAKRYDQIGAVMQHGLLIATITSIPIMLIMWKIQWILAWMGQSVDITQMDQSYFMVYMWLVPGMLWTIAIQQTLLAVRKQQFVMWMSVFGLIVSIGCGYTLIYGLGLGIPGLGYAYAIQVWASFIIYVLYALFQKDVRAYQLFKWCFYQNWSVLKKLLKVGWPMCLQMASDLLTFSFITIMAGWLGEQALAAQQISTQFFVLLVVPIFGVAQASGILIGQAQGAKQSQDVRRYSIAALTIGVSFAVVVALIFMTLSHTLVSWYEGSHTQFSPEVIHLASIVLMITGARLVFDAAAEIYAGCLRGLYDTKFPMMVLIVMGWLVGVPLTYYMAFKTPLGLIGISATSVLCTLVALSILLFRWRYQCNRLKQLPH